MRNDGRYDLCFHKYQNKKTKTNVWAGHTARMTTTQIHIKFSARRMEK